MRLHFLISIVLVIVTSLFLFPISFSFLPEFVNTKMILAVIGVVAFTWESLRKGSLSVSWYALLSVIFAVLFSVWCYYSIVANGGGDNTYVRYWLSFAAWLGSAYAVCFFIRHLDGDLDLEKLVFYLSATCVIQCLLAWMIDSIPSLQRWVSAYIVQGEEFYQRVNRWYGIGAALDTAGVRFSVVLILMAHVMTTDTKVAGTPWVAFYYFPAFIWIVIIGSIIARTTWVGALMALGYMIISYLRVRHGSINKEQVSFWVMLFLYIVIAVGISAWLYNKNPDFRQNLRFGFEGFFNWVETGVFRTDSTDKLNSIMWVWPKDTRTWIIGTGLFDNWVYGTDIGYCRFTLYCGLVGMTLFSLFFIFNGIAINYQLEHVALLSIFLIALTFVIWFKVATDIYFIYALITCLGSGKQEEPFLSE